MRNQTFLLIFLISSCVQPEISNDNKESELVISTNSKKQLDRTYSEEIEEIEPSFPDWLTENYPTELELGYGYTVNQELKDYRIVNDSISFCIYEQMDGVCSRSILDTYTEQIKTDSLHIAEACDHDLSNPVYTWMEYETRSLNLIVIKEFTESVVDSFLTDNGEIKGGYDFIEVETKFDTTRTVYQINERGKIKEIKK